jgi:DNA-binding GntR family transcriptional regulator
MSSVETGRDDPARGFRWDEPTDVIANDLREAIEAGTYPVGSLLPPNDEIRAQYKVATGTVSRAVGLLKEAGLVYAVRGKRPKVIAADAIAPGGSI